MDQPEHPIVEHGNSAGENTQDVGASATGIFAVAKAGELSSSERQSEDSLSALPVGLPASVAPRVASSPDAKSDAAAHDAPGEFTRMFPARQQSLSRNQPEVTRSPQPINIFTKLPTPRSASLTQSSARADAAADNRPTLSTAVKLSHSQTEAEPAGNAQSVAGSGGITQLLRQMSGPEPEGTQRNKPSQVEAAPQPSPVSSTPRNAFDNPNHAAASPPSKEEESFTAFFRSLSPPQRGGASVEAGAEPNAARDITPGAFTQAFQAISVGTPAAPVGPAFDLDQFQALPSVSPFPVQDVISPANLGGFTQLLESLSSADRSPAPVLKSAPALPFAALQGPSPTVPDQPADGTGPGEFTRILQSLAQPAPPVGAEALPAPMAQLLAQEGPGEFTRVISGSDFRGAQGPGAGPAMPAGGALAAPQFALPARPQLAMPTAPAFPPAPAFTAPPPPVASGLPIPGSVAGKSSRFQQYLPLLLVVNIFVMLLVGLFLYLLLHKR